MKTMKKQIILLAASCLSFIAQVIFYVGHTADRVPVHFSASMTVDRVGSKWGMLLFGLLPIALSLFYLLYARSPKGRKNERLEGYVLPGIIGFFLYLSFLLTHVVLTTAPVLGTKSNVDLMDAIIIPMGILLTLLANYMGKIKPNRTFGLRLPWTLRDETVWNRTHRLAGYTGVAGGILMIVCGIAGTVLDLPILAVCGTIAEILLFAVIPGAYSFLLYRKRHNAKEA